MGTTEVVRIFPHGSDLRHLSWNCQEKQLFLRSYPRGQEHQLTNQGNWDFCWHLLSRIFCLSLMSFLFPNSNNDIINCKLPRVPPPKRRFTLSWIPSEPAEIFYIAQLICFSLEVSWPSLGSRDRWRGRCVRCPEQSGSVSFSPQIKSID